MIDQVHSPVDNSTIGVDINISAWDLIGKSCLTIGLSFEQKEKTDERISVMGKLMLLRGLGLQSIGLKPSREKAANLLFVSCN